MKKRSILLLCAALAISLTSCHKEPNQSSTPSSDMTDAPETAAIIITSHLTESPEPLATETEPQETQTVPAITETEPLPTQTVPMVTETEPVETTSEPIYTTAPKETTVPEETTAPQVPVAFDYEKSDLTKYAVLGKYKGIEVYAPAPRVITDIEIEEPINNFIETLGAEDMIYNHAAELYNKVNISYTCTVDGALFKPACKENVVFTIGDGEFVELFEENILGMLPGDTKNIEFRIPASYGDAYAGKTAVFSIVLNFVYPTLNDDLAAKYFGFSSAEEVRAIFRAHLEGEALKEVAEERRDAAWTKVLANSRVIEYPESALDNAFNKQYENYENMAAAAGLTYEQFLSETFGISSHEADLIMIETAKNQVKQKIILYLLAKDLGIPLNVEAYRSEMEERAEDGGFSSLDEMLASMGYTKSKLKDYIIFEKALSIVIENANFIDF
ncbi:MAG: FKBP-type peptidyl-prolyl cis-trans isomerase [Clostridia bacterium]|nr:FKBP-type peptidyl-prolyl cis-trans isomerase [Clostridia bacterium]